MPPASVPAQEAIAAAGGKAEAELRVAIQMYDDALGRVDVAAAERFWAEEYVFINPRGERVFRDARVVDPSGRPVATARKPDDADTQAA